MPQMAPLNWTLLYLVITSLFMTILIMKFFLFLHTPKKKKLEIFSKSLFWKW
uniref:ATP synthase F0 subunit 8 n=1 Tax=Trigonopterus triradiatus TaxID=2678947 RepID=A0A7H1KHW9_9CUCU|nr:ATP synthase F0 subunit 8 [Trigonopterus triradiatus]QNT26885.1 ATP synthase F0 subunit 8 [Trigonopterus triradiatus]